MNIVKLQNDLKDLSDRQLMDSMNMGSAPQYLVLAEMQRRKKMRDEAATQSPQSESTVADEIMGGIAQLPMQAPQMASGGLVSFARGGYAKGEAEACWENPETGEQMCPPGKPDVRYPTTKGGSSASKSKMAGGGIVALQAGGTPSEARMRLTNMGIDTAGLSDEQVMELDRAEASNGVVETTGDTATGFGFIGPEAPSSEVAPPSVTEPEPAPKAEPGFMDKVTSGITSLLGMGEVQASEPPPPPATSEPPPPATSEPPPPEVQLGVEERFLQQFPGSDPEGDAERLARARQYQTEADALAAQGFYDKAEAMRAKADELLSPFSPEKRIGTLIQGAETSGFSVNPFSPHFFGEDTEYSKGQMAKAREMYEALKNSDDPKDQEMAKALAAQYPVALGGVTAEQYKADQKAKTEGQGTSLDDLPTRPPSDVYESAMFNTSPAYEYLDTLKSARKALESKESSAANQALIAMGLSMMASKNPDFMGALGEGGLKGLEAYQQLNKDEKKELADAFDREIDVVKAIETGSGLAYRSGMTSSLAIANSLKAAADDLVKRAKGTMNKTDREAYLRQAQEYMRRYEEKMKELGALPTTGQGPAYRAIQ
jgi:tetratricopeptide (TPR) repeat protein